MNFDQSWTTLAVEAEVETHGATRVAAVHNALRSRVANVEAERNILTRQRDALREEAIDAKRKLAEMTQAVGLVTTIKGSMVMRPDDPIGMMQEVAAYVGELYDGVTVMKCEYAAAVEAAFKEAAAQLDDAGVDAIQIHDMWLASRAKAALEGQ